MIEHVLGLRILLVHSLEKDFTNADKMHADIVLYGHTHRPEIIVEDGLLMMNPGHLKSEMDKHTKPSFGLLDIRDETVTVKLIGADFKEIECVDLVRSESGLYRS